MNISNTLTVSRIFMVPVIALLLFRDDLIQSVIAAAIFSAAMVTDYLDGYFARKLHIESDLGKLLDPLADKFLTVTVLIMLIPLGRVPAWMAAIIIGRELAVTGVRGLASEKKVIIAATSDDAHTRIARWVAAEAAGEERLELVHCARRF